MAVGEEEVNQLNLSLIYSKANGATALPVCSSLTGQELKERIRETLDISVDASLLLFFQNGSRNAAKSLVEDAATLAAQGFQDGASVTVKADAQEVKPQSSALRHSIRENGTSSYYYAHANEKELPPEVRYAYGGAPTKMSEEQAPEVTKALPVQSMAKYSWADEGEFVCIYISVEGEPEAVQAAGDGKAGQVQVEFGQRSVDLQILASEREFRLAFRELEGEIVPEECKNRVSAGKRVTLKLKKKNQVTWTRLVRPKMQG
ncbi:unnamed protein product [Polarella glacialis]|uniref:CS domain-containing protein n=1 Tax=Polarella glacialis TaxID=89957 RepID=A0A813K135_POLGL|nr:unnamed protein product [Polarella glacialis]